MSATITDTTPSHLNDLGIKQYEITIPLAENPLDNKPDITFVLDGKRYHLGFVGEGQEGNRETWDGTTEREVGPWVYYFGCCVVSDNRGGSLREAEERIAAGREIEFGRWETRLTINGQRFIARRMKRNGPGQDDQIQFAKVHPCTRDGLKAAIRDQFGPWICTDEVLESSVWEGDPYEWGGPNALFTISLESGLPLTEHIDPWCRVAIEGAYVEFINGGVAAVYPV